MMLFRSVIVVAIFSATPTLGADVNRGRDIATHECAACHPVGPQRNELADAPPFTSSSEKGDLTRVRLHTPYWSRTPR